MTCEYSDVNLIKIQNAMRSQNLLNFYFLSIINEIKKMYTIKYLLAYIYTILKSHLSLTTVGLFIADELRPTPSPVTVHELNPC